MTAETANNLFREQVTERRRQRLYGDVVLSDSRISSRLVVGIAAISLLLIVWATTATYPRTEAVPGVVMTSQPSAKVFAIRNGVAERVFVRDGSAVRRGQPLVFIGVDMRDEDTRGAARDSLTALTGQTDSVKAQMQAAHDALSSEREKLSASLETNAGEQATLREQSVIQAAIIRSKEEEIRRITPVAEKGFISQMEMDRRRQSLLAERQRAEQIKQQLVQLATRRNETVAQLRRLPMDELREKAQLQGELGSLFQQRSRARVDVGYTILAPVDGRVTALQASSGRSVDPRVPLLSVMPQRSVFQVQLYAPSKAVGFIRVGQQVRISYDAFPYKQFGTFAGTIASISRTAYAPGEIDVPVKIEEPVYLIRVRLANETVPAFGKPLPLQSGMTLQGTVILERRSFVDWLLQPLNSVRKRT